MHLLIAATIQTQSRHVVCPACRRGNIQRSQAARQIRCRHCHKVFAVAAGAVRARSRSGPSTGLLDPFTRLRRWLVPRNDQP